ncbi:MAG TPA: hypothetical protein VK625_00655 [Flavitalea sp.]|nr:hypothetical protein [Flavitalea sp.]
MTNDSGFYKYRNSGEGNPYSQNKKAFISAADSLKYTLEKFVHRCDDPLMERRSQRHISIRGGANGLTFLAVKIDSFVTRERYFPLSWLWINMWNCVKHFDAPLVRLNELFQKTSHKTVDMSPQEVGWSG